METAIWTGVSIIAGAIISAGIGWWFARQSSHELAEEAEKIRLHNEILMRALENAGLDIKFNRDERGRVIGTIVDLEASVVARPTVNMEIKVIRRGDTRDSGSREEDKI